MSASTAAARAVLDRFSAGIPEGATAIVGPSGAGKSTLLRLLNRLADPDRGEIAYRGRPLDSYEPLALRREVALVPQLPALLEGTVGVQPPLRGRARRASRWSVAATACGSPASTRASPGATSRKLSVGEQQRAMLARALAQRPRVLLLDEPTSALDHAARDAVEAALAELRARARDLARPGQPRPRAGAPARRLGGAARGGPRPSPRRDASEVSTAA